MNDELEERQTQVTFFNSLVPRATEALQEPCLVCFDDIESASITKCGHIFCTRWYVDHALVVVFSIRFCLSLAVALSLSRGRSLKTASHSSSCSTQYSSSCASSRQVSHVSRGIATLGCFRRCS